MKAWFSVVDFLVIKTNKKGKKSTVTWVSFVNELASIGPRVNGVYCEIRLPSVRVLTFV